MREGEIDNSLNEIESLGIKVLKNLDSRKLTTMFVGGDIKNLIEGNSVKELSSILKILSSTNTQYRILGAGSNLLLDSKGIDDPVIKLGKSFRYYNNIGKGLFEVGASMPLMSLSRELSNQGFSGLEFAGGIPASIGGALKMNAGAHGNEIKDILKSVTYITSNGDVVTKDINDLKFEYRCCSLPADSIVVEIQIQLKKSTVEVTSELRASCLKERKLRQPLSMPSSGSVFKNPSPKKAIYAGKLIEDLNLKGLKVGEAQISEMHANWIVNPSRKATSFDIIKLIELIKAKVYKEYKVKIEQEVIFWQSKK